MRPDAIIENTRIFVHKKLVGEGSGHDWWHVVRVTDLAKQIARKEGADSFVVTIAALLHDIADWKFHNGDKEVGPTIAGDFLHKQGVASDDIEHVCSIIRDISFMGGNVKPAPMKTLAGMVVQDADRLDALGAIGIARTFAYGGYKGNEIYNPTIKPALHTTAEAYKKSDGPAINHFYEKLLLLKDRMNTPSGRRIALKRHAFMEKFLQTFFEEVGGFCEEGKREMQLG
ncbi:HD domain-containing protein [Candidatus Babeliales bacterium]|nr:HD domain-containing protein [Candidatus Babeliales bacterium]